MMKKADCLTSWLAVASGQRKYCMCATSRASVLIRGRLSHDDITYQSIANAFNLPLKLYPEAFERMKKLSKTSVREPGFDWEADSPALQAKLRMVRLPTDESRPLSDQFLFVSEDLWVPIAVVNGNIYILPGVPSLCTSKRLWHMSTCQNRLPAIDTRRT